MKGTTKLRTFHRLTLTVCLGLASAALLAQHDTAADIEDGGRVFQNSCANCHGPDRDEIAGVDLGRGQFRRASSDQDLIQIIRNGIPGTPMPANNFSEEQAARVVAYLRSVARSRMSGTTVGDAARGKVVFPGKGTCVNCHRVDGDGGRLGPALSSIGHLRRATLDKKWEFKMNDITWGGVLSTASDLIFCGGKEGYFLALDARTGALLWKMSLGGQINSGPMSYSIGGRQYVTVAAGNALFAFALRQWQTEGDDNGTKKGV
jgi:mono/diheme cytochrome c family protein